MPLTPTLTIRADGGPGIGVGHLARCLALCQAWIARHGSAVLVADQPPPFWRDRFVAEGCDVIDPAESTPACDWWVVDGYHLALGAQSPGRHHLRIDDRDGAGTHGMGADLVLDQGLGALRSLYPQASQVLSGPRYALLRREVVSAVSSKPSSPRGAGPRLVVVFGGAPTPEVISLQQSVLADERLAGLDVTVAAGHDEIGPLLAQADIGLAAAGSVSWELCLHGVPAVLVPVAENQEAVADGLAAAGAAVSVRAEANMIASAVSDLVSRRELWPAMGDAGRRLVDGYGARRVVARLRAALLNTRDATAADAERIHRWNDDPVTRAASFSVGSIPWDTHVAWLAKRLADPRAATFVASDPSGADVGLVRFDVDADGVATIGVTLAPERRGQGWGGGLIQAGCTRIAERDVRQIVALIKQGNRASISAFVDAEFDLEGDGGPSVVRYSRRLDDQ